MKVSIIIPIYNMQDYLSRCLDSILAQTHSNFEAICVNDGSTDGSAEICDQYMSRDSRVKVHHITNGGVSNARNYALTRIEGEWFTFVDSDDWIEPDYIELLLKNAVDNACDISACAFQRNNEYMLGYDTDNVKTILFDSTRECMHGFICPGDSLEGISCNKLYRADIFRDICFDTDIRVNEDCDYTYRIMERCRKACLTTAKIYHWFFRADSASQSKKLACDFCAANVFRDLYEKTLYLKDSEITQTLQKNYICSVLKILMYANYAKSDVGVQEAKRQCGLWKKDVWHLFDARTRLKYILALHMPWIFRVLQ